MPISTTDVPQSRTFQRELDPHGRLDYTIDWANILGENNIVSVTTTLSAEAITAGLEIDAESTDGQTTTVRLSVESTQRDDEAFNAPFGIDLAFKQNLEDSTGQIWEFSYVVTVVQQ